MGNLNSNFDWLSLMNAFISGFIPYLIDSITNIIGWFVRSPFAIVSLVCVCFLIGITNNLRFFLYAITILAALVILSYTIQFFGMTIGSIV